MAPLLGPAWLRLEVHAVAVEQADGTGARPRLFDGELAELVRRHRVSIREGVRAPKPTSSYPRDFEVWCGLVRSTVPPLPSLGPVSPCRTGLILTLNWWSWGDSYVRGQTGLKGKVNGLRRLHIPPYLPPVAPGANTSNAEPQMQGHLGSCDHFKTREPSSEPDWTKGKGGISDPRPASACGHLERCRPSLGAKQLIVCAAPRSVCFRSQVSSEGRRHPAWRLTGVRNSTA